MWGAIFIFAKEELVGLGEDEIAAAPVFEPVGLFGEPSGEGYVGDGVDYFCFWVDVRLACGCVVVWCVSVVGVVVWVVVWVVVGSGGGGVMWLLVV